MMRLLQDLRIQPQQSVAAGEAFTRIEPYLFDYLFRLIAVHDVVIAHLQTIKVAIVDNEPVTFGAFVITAFNKAHNLSVSDWSHDTSELDNAAYAPRSSAVQDDLLVSARLGALPADVRELVILHDLMQFNMHDIVALTRINQTVIQQMLSDARELIARESKLPILRVLQVIRNLRLHPIDAEEPHEKTLALSQIIGSFDDANIGPSWRRPFYLLLVIAVIAGLSWFFIARQ